MERLRWYDKFAPVYDVGTFGDWFYRRAREASVEQLELCEGARVVDVFCGTGINFPLLTEHVGASGHILGVDGSRGMLKQARRRRSNMKSGRRHRAIAGGLFRAT